MRPRRTIFNLVDEDPCAQSGDKVAEALQGVDLDNRISDAIDTPGGWSRVLFGRIFQQLVDPE